MGKKPNGTKAPAEGHNLIGIDREEFNAWVAKVSAADAACKKANAERQAVRKAMRAAGVKLTEFDAMRKLAELARGEQAEKLQHSRYYLEWLRSPLGHQITMNFEMAHDAFDEDDAKAESQITEDASGAGWRAGLAGTCWEDDCPHDVNTPQGQAWLGAYREAQEKRAASLAES